VGRPVVKGMDGYRVGVTNGNVILNDLSAMSQDHAVGVMPRATKKIELIKGPASLLYGSYSGGVIRTLGEEHERAFLKEGYSLETTSSHGSNGAGTMLGAIGEASEGDISVSLNSFYHNASNYQDGEGNTIKDSNTLSKQSHLVLGYRINDENNIKLYLDRMDKEYGIPNSTSKATSIDMEQQRWGGVWHSNNLFNILEYAQTEIAYSDYTHYELEGESYDGLFAQEQLSLSTMFGIDFGDWHLDANVESFMSDLQVCHDHGNCDKFYKQNRISGADGAQLQRNYEKYGEPFSHGHPMPDTKESTFKSGFALRNFHNDDNEVTLSLRGETRLLTPDSSNMQQEWLVNDRVDANYYDTLNQHAVSASAGWVSFLSDSLSMQSSLSYVERLPAATELFWNGFHHATNTYVMGDRYLNNEQSFNLDVDILYTHGDFTTQGSFFYYHFLNYIYQTPLLDSNSAPVNVKYIEGVGHNAYAWAMRGMAAKVYGAALKESHKREFGAQKFISTLALEAISGKLEDESYIPRMPPFSATLSFEHIYKQYKSKLSYKQVDESRFEGAHETKTPSYGWLSAYIEYLYKSRYVEGTLFLKGENLTDAQAYNHLSFLKATAPFAGRQVSGGLSLRF
jgi:iron complex outermembrane receptor protein